MYRAQTQDRVKSMAAVAAFHALLGYAIVTGLGFDPVTAIEERMTLFEVPAELLPPPIEAATPAPQKSEERTERIKPAPKDPEGAAAPPNLKASPTQIVAPKREVVLEVKTPVIAAPVAGPGAEASAGASTMAGPGTGAGGFGTGLGSGAFGSGTGGGGGGTIARKARYVSGEIRQSDVTRCGGNAAPCATGTVYMRLLILPSGRVGGCTIARSTTGDRRLDAETCRAAERRLRYRAAIDAWGRRVSATEPAEHEWYERRQPDRWIEADIPDDE